MVLLCALAGRAGGTSVVVIRTPQEVVIAADSAVIIQGDGLTPSTGSACKIFAVDDKLYFAVSGIVNDSHTGFHVPEIVASIARQGGAPSAMQTKIETEVTAAVLRELPEVKIRDPQGFEKLAKAPGAVSVMLAGIDKGVPFATSFSLGLTRSADGSAAPVILRDSCPGNCASGVRAFEVGESAAIEQLRKSGGMPALPMPELARYLVQAEIDSRAPNVGGPIDVLRITPEGPIWVQKKSSCPATAPAPSR